MWRKIFLALAIAWCLVANDAAAWYIQQPFNSTQQNNLCSWLGSSAKRRAWFKDVYKAGDTPPNTMYPGSYCPLTGGRDITAKMCWVDEYVGRMHFTQELGQLSGSAKNKVTQVSFEHDACYKYYTTSGFASFNHPDSSTYMCADKIPMRKNLYPLPGEPLTQASLDVIDCGNMFMPGSGGWRDSYGGKWYVLQDNQSPFLTGYINTDVAYEPEARCGWWNIQGTLTSDGFIGISATNPAGSGYYYDTYAGRLKKDTCLGFTTFSSGRMWQWESLYMRFTNELGLGGPFKMVRFGTPAWWDFSLPVPLPTTESTSPFPNPYCDSCSPLYDQWGTTGDIPAPGDYDGDTTSDVAVWRPSDMKWYIWTSSTGYTLSTAMNKLWGTTGDIPVPGDYDGDGRNDLAMYRPSDRKWYILKSSSGYVNSSVWQWGVAGDIPAPGDYDGDGKADLTIYRPNGNVWWIASSQNNYASYTTLGWGGAGDVPASGDYDGDGKSDVTMWRPSTGVWWVLKSSSNFTNYFTKQWGTVGDKPYPGDFDGDGMTDMSIWRPSESKWYILESSSGY